MIWKKILKYIAVFAVTIAVLTGLLALSVKIPAEKIREHMLSSADILCRENKFYNAIEGVKTSRIDHYADAITLSIAWHFGEEEVLPSIMRCAYYTGTGEQETYNFRNSLREGYAANREYLRYWHGSAAVARLMHLFTDVQGMYIAGAVLLVLLLAGNLWLLMKHRLYGGAAGLVCGLVIVNVWFVPMALEYLWVFLIMLSVSMAAVKLTVTGRRDTLPVLFLLSGILTNFLDFLTSETLTLTVPLLLSIYAARRIHHAEAKENAGVSLRAALLWGAGYVGTWVMKWILAAAVLRENVLPYIGGHIEERAGFGDENMTRIYLLHGIPRNLASLFPAGYGKAGMAAAVVLVIAVAYLLYVYRKKDADRKSLLLYAVIGLLPYLRYLLMLDHSYWHFFFTCRAQAATALAVCLILVEGTVFFHGRSTVSAAKTRSSERKKHEVSKKKRT